MCGIAGIASTKGGIEAAHIKAMADVLRHRGPDDEGYIAVGASSGEVCELIGPGSKVAGGDIRAFSKNAKVFLGHRRLSILDLSPAGHQPMPDSRRENWVVFNGEIYNYVELRDELCALGHVFRTKTDTEVLLAAYAEWGEACLQRFNGMWAFVIYDAKSNRLFGARDRFGVKPLYYIRNGPSFAFASEIKALLKLPDVRKKINDAAAFDYLAVGMEEGREEGLFEGIYELQPSCSFEYGLASGSFAVKRYYTLEFNGSRDAFDEKTAARHVAATKERLFEAVRLRLRSDVPVGTCLSGGIDSSSIVCVINSILGEGSMAQVGDRQKVFTASYDLKDVDESKWAGLVASSTRTEWIRTYPAAADMANDLEDLVYSQDIPFGSTSIYAQYRVMRLAAENGVKVLLDGQGGDEIFSGYHGFYAALFAEAVTGMNVPAFVREMRRLGNSPVTARFVIKSLVKHLASHVLPAPVLRKAYSKKSRALRYLDRGFWDRNKHRLDELPGRKRLSLNSQMHHAMTSYGLKSLLRYEDRNSMRFSIESRTPFADDIGLIEGTFAIPGAFKIHNGWSKYLLREAMRGVIPDDIRERKDKVGFATPERLWLAELKDKMRGYIDGGLSGFVDTRALLKDWDGFAAGQFGVGENAWRIINFAVWKKVYGL